MKYKRYQKFIFVEGLVFRPYPSSLFDLLILSRKIMMSYIV